MGRQPSHTRTLAPLTSQTFTTGHPAFYNQARCLPSTNHHNRITNNNLVSLNSNSFKNNTVVVGGGYWGKNLLRAFSQLGALYGVCETDARVLRQIREEYPGIVPFRNIDTVIADQNAENIVIATPAETHYEIAMLCLQSGRHTFVEKPLALTYEQGQNLVELAESSGLTLFVGHLLEYHGAIERLEELVYGGELGAIQYIYSNRLNLGKVRREENILWSFAPHDISVILRLVKAMPEQVACFGGSYLQANVADVTISTMGFPNDIRSHIFVSWLHPYKEQKLVVVGSEKMALFDDVAADGKLKLYDERIQWVDGQPIPLRSEGQAITFDGTEPLIRECRAFLESVEQGIRPITDGYNGLRVVRILQAFQQSLKSGGANVPITETYKPSDIHE